MQSAAAPVSVMDCSSRIILPHKTAHRNYQQRAENGSRHESRIGLTLLGNLFDCYEKDNTMNQHFAQVNEFVYLGATTTRKRLRPIRR